MRRTALVTKSGVKVGLMGIAEDWLGHCSQLKPGELKYEDFIEAATQAAAQLRSEGAELVLALTHNRLQNDRKLAAANPGVDFFLGGHDHFYKRDREHRLVKGGQEFRWLSHVTFDVCAGGAAPVVIVDRYDVDEEIAEDAAMKEVVDKYISVRDRKYKHVLVGAGVDLHAEESFVRYKEGALTGWVCDALTEDYSAQEGLQSADPCLLQGFNFKSDRAFPKGEMTLGDLFAIFPFETTAIVVKLTGEEIVQTLRRGAKFLPGECGSLFHCSARLQYTVTLTDSKFNDVSAVMFDGESIDPARSFTVVLANDPSSLGSYGFTWLGAAERVVSDEFALTIQDVLCMWCRRHTGADAGADVAAGRITIQ